MKSIFEKLKAYCVGEFVFREDIKQITGGILNHHTMAQLDSQSWGIKNRQFTKVGMANFELSVAKSRSECPGRRIKVPRFGCGTRRGIGGFSKIFAGMLSKVKKEIFSNN